MPILIFFGTIELVGRPTNRNQVPFLWDYFSRVRIYHFPLVSTNTESPELSILLFSESLRRKKEGVCALLVTRRTSCSYKRFPFYPHMTISLPSNQGQIARLILGVKDRVVVIALLKWAILEEFMCLLPLQVQ